jgi:catechol 2,3-dioxygenase-like lactoylglutathione lyase family enzyme
MSALEPAHAGAPDPRCVTVRLTQLTRVVADLGVAENFYCAALGFRPVSRGADAARLVLGEESLALVQPSPAPSPYPADSRSNDLWFQHLAIVVADMDRAYAHLCACPGWQPISTGGPQLLPASSGGVRAFKFRDPDGHPLELLWFPAARTRAAWQRHVDAGSLFLGIAHTALAIAETRRSLRFYAQLGWTLRYRSLNRGTSQARLDGLEGARVRVLGLRAASPEGPGIELLAYRPPGRPIDGHAACSLASDSTVLGKRDRAADSAALSLTDPDGHRLLVPGQATNAGASTMNPKPPTSPKFFRNSQKCSSPSPSSNRQNPGKRQN